MILDLQVVHHLPHIGDGVRNFSGAVALELGVDFTGQSDDSAFNSVFHKIAHLVLDECGVQVFLDAGIQIGVHRFGVVFPADGNHRNLVGNDLGTGERLRKILGLRYR